MGSRELFITITSFVTCHGFVFINVLAIESGPNLNNTVFQRWLKIKLKSYKAPFGGYIGHVTLCLLITHIENRVYHEYLPIVQGIEYVLRATVQTLHVAPAEITVLLLGSKALLQLPSIFVHLLLVANSNKCF